MNASVRIDAVTVVVGFTLAALMAGVGTGLVRRYALSRSLLDLPNHRSSHDAPTPRGAGLAIAIVVLGLTALATAAGLVPLRLAAALLGGGIVVASVGWIDDHRGLAASVRALAHLAAAIWSVAWLDGVPAIAFGTTRLELGSVGSVLAVVGTVWLINAYNFMDGIDGIAGVTGLIAATFGSLLLIRADPATALVSAVVAGSCAGFLAWNWPPAQIFLGDIGSGLLGFLFATCAIGAESRGAPGVLLVLLLLGVFVVDATVTLVRRVLRSERWYEAHRSHAYQRLVQAGWSHRAVTCAVAGVEVVLGLGAMLVAERPALTAYVIVAAALGLGMLYWLVERTRAMSRVGSSS